MNLGINPLMQLGLPEKRKRMCEVLLTEICKIHHTPFDMVTIGDPSLDVGDEEHCAEDGEQDRVRGAGNWGIWGCHG